MHAQSEPLVSIVTPLYNGAEFLAECIESALAQTYPNWDYTIVDNCSTDESLAIARKYAARDPRMRVLTNDRFLSILENHNHAIRQISLASKYCKFIFADDWLYPNCIEEMVRLAEQYPSVGLVGAYTMDGRAVRWHGPPYPSRHVSGRKVCRDRLLGGPYVFGTMTSLLIRSDLVRKRPRFFNEQNLQADLEACFDVLQESDFGFLHQVLSFSRERAHTTDSFASNLNSQRLGDFLVLLKYGPIFLEEGEYRQQLKKGCRQYHKVLAHNVLRLRPKQFWDFHKETLAAAGGRIDPWLLTTSVLTEAIGQLLHPLNAFRRGRRWWSSSVRRADGKKVDDYRQSIRKEVSNAR